MSKKRLIQNFLVFAIAATMYVGAGLPGTYASPAMAEPSTANLGRNCYSVNDFGADPTGANESTPAFRAAFQAANVRNGVDVCAPAGTYLIGGDITLFSRAGSGTQATGPSFYGAGPGITILQAKKDYFGYIFDSCPPYSNVTPSMPIPASCPATNPSPSAFPPPPGTFLTGVTFKNFSIAAATTSAQLPGSNSGFYFPNVSGLLIDNVCETGGSYPRAPPIPNVPYGFLNVFDFGNRSGASFSNIVIRDATCQAIFSGHYIALHGGGDGLVVERNSIRGNGGNSYPNLFLDTSDMVGGTAQHIDWRNNDFEGPFLGMFAFLPKPISGGSATKLIDAEWSGNIYDGCIFFCYNFAVESNPAAPPSFANVRLADKWAISLYDSVNLDGGLSTAAGTGVQGVKIAGPSLYGGADKKGVGASFFMITAPPSPTGGLTSTSVEFVIPASSFVASYSAMSTDTVGIVAANLASAINGGSAPTVSAFNAPLANPWYGAIALQPIAPMALGPGQSGIFPYEVITTGSLLRPLNWTGQTCSVLPPLSGTPAPCMTGSFDIGDGIAVRNEAHDFEIEGARVQAPSGSSIHIWPGGGNAFRIINNVLGENKGPSAFTALQLDMGAANPTDYLIVGNDLVGATNPLLSTLPPPIYLGGGQAPIIRNNRGAAAIASNPTTVMTGSSGGTLYSFVNVGPLDCIYYFSAWSGLVSTTLTIPGSATTTLPNSEPGSVLVPVGATLQSTSSSTSSVTYVTFCQP